MNQAELIQAMNKKIQVLEEQLTACKKDRKRLNEKSKTINFNKRELLIAYEIKMSNSTEENAENLVDAYLSHIKSKKDTSEKQTFEDVCKPLIKWIEKNHHPHTMIEIDSNKAILWEGKKAYKTE